MRYIFNSYKGSSPVADLSRNQAMMMTDSGLPACRADQRHQQEPIPLDEF
jgi:hypothetical protein